MGTNLYISIHPDPREVRADIEGAPRPSRFGGYRCVEIGSVSIFISDRYVLDALQAALGVIRAAVDAEEYPVPPPEAVAS